MSFALPKPMFVVALGSLSTRSISESANADIVSSVPEYSLRYIVFSGIVAAFLCFENTVRLL